MGVVGRPVCVFPPILPNLLSSYASYPCFSPYKTTLRTRSKGGNNVGKVVKGLVLFVCLVTFAVAPATAQVNTELSGTIEFMVWGNVRSNEIDQMVIDAFQAKYPNIKVELRNPGGNHKEQLLTSIAGGLAPDIAIVDFYDLPELIEAGLIFDVTAWAERDGIYDEIRAELHPAALGEMEYK